MLVIIMLGKVRTQIGQEGKLDPHKSEIRMGYGIMYENWGSIYHSLNVYDLVIAIDLPQINFTNPIGDEVLQQFDKHCEDINTDYVDIIDICYYIWPLYYHYREQEYDYQVRIKEMLTQNIPRILPNFQQPKVEIEELPVLPDIDPLRRLTEMQADHLKRIHGQGITQEHINKFIGTLGIFKHMMEHIQDRQTENETNRNTRSVTNPMNIITLPTKPSTIENKKIEDETEKYNSYETTPEYEYTTFTTEREEINPQIIQEKKDVIYIPEIYSTEKRSVNWTTRENRNILNDGYQAGYLTKNTKYYTKTR